MKLFSTKRGKYEGRHSGHHKNRGSVKSVLPLCLMLILGVCLTIGGTLAFMQEQSDTVTNSFKAGNIKYTLNLEANADNANEKYEDTDVEMPDELTAEQTTDLSVTFTPDKVPELTGYTFSGWYYDAACSAEYTDVSGAAITVKYGDPHDSDAAANKVEITLYANWTPNTYEVVYNGNGHTGGTMENSTHTYEVEACLTENAYTRTGYIFLGWSTDPDTATAEYTDMQPVINLTSENNGRVNLYAVWEQKDFTVSFDTQAADVQNPSNQTVTYNEPYGELPEVSRIGYTFEGWALDKEGTNSVTKDSIVGIAKDHTLYAKWTPIQYTVVYDKNGDDKAGITGSTESSIHTYDIEKNLTENGYARTGYTFIGWNTKSDGTGVSYADVESVKNLTSEPDGTVTLYAQWGAKSYIIRYHANGGEGTMADQTIKYDVPTALRKNVFTKNDYSFRGWALSSDGEDKYIDEQIVVNLLESGTLDLYAVWIQDSHTVTFDYNGGYGSPADKQVQAGKAYGTLPEYPVHPTKAINDNEIMSYLFTGWYTAPSGGTRVYPSDIVQRIENHTLYAQWKEAPTNNVIKDLVVKNNPDDNKDGVVDSFYVNLKCSSTFEKLNIPLENLIVGQKYKLSFTESNNATYGNNETGYGGAIYGFIITKDKTLTGGSIKKESIADGGLIKEWSDRNDGDLNGPRTWETTFTAEAGTMYWTWDYGLILDGYPRDYNYTNIQLVPVEPEIEFADKELVIHDSSKARVMNDNSSTYATNFIFDGDSYAETIYFPITGLTAGTTYTITFDHKFSGSLINSNSYQYGCGIMNTVPTKYGSYMSSISDSWASNTFVMSSVTGNTESVTLIFTATSNTAYWVWNMANCSDSNNCTIDVKVTKFSASHKNGDSITYYDAASQATTLGLVTEPVDAQQITFIWDGINDTHMDVWYPVDEQNPVAGDSYELAFEPMEGYTMSEIITVTIEDVCYEVYTDGREISGTTTPFYNTESNILTIPADLLTLNTTTVAVTASAVPIDIIITTEPEESTDETEAGAYADTASAEDAEIAATLNLTNITAQGGTTLMAGTDYKLVLTLVEGYILPEVLYVEIDGILYEVYTDGLEHRILADGETELPPMPAFDQASGTLTIPAVLLGETTESVMITIAAVEIETVPVKTETLENSEETEEVQETTPEPAQAETETVLEETAAPAIEDALPPDDGGDPLNTDEEVDGE